MSYQQSATMTDGSYNRAAASAYGQPNVDTRQQCDTLGQSIYPHGHIHHAPQTENALSAMVSSFTNTHLGVPGANMSGAGGIGTNQYPMNATGHYFYTADGQLVFTPGTGLFPTQMPTAQASDIGYGTYPGAMPYMPQATYPGYLSGYPMVPFTPGRTGYWSERSESLHKEVPGLDNRRGSYSTNESTPGTPFYGALNARDHGANTHIATIDRSPIYSTPSPQSLPHAVQQVGKPLPYKGASLAINNVDLDTILLQYPAIPRAVPAVFTPRENMRTLDQSLSNPIVGNRNVYIRGLHPHTNDETLAAFASRFGKIETSKAIIDTSTGACKGFGFAKYCDVKDSEMCIRGFYKLGYEVGFARESFNSRLKAEGDDNSTNLYVSNLPKSMTESELGAIFMDYTVSSSRILRDSHGQSRGVGFARFESRDVCEEIIKKFHGQAIGDEGLLLQVRYADTPAQKDLKRVTTERRQFRTNEYNVSAYGGAADMIALSPSSLSPLVSKMSQNPRHIPQSRASSASWKRDFSGSTANSSVDPIAFKDFDRASVKIDQEYTSPSSQADRYATASTPTVSDDGSGDEGATVHGASPTVTYTAASPSVR